jgi:cyclohexyl-isocyanide hydratase
MSIPLFVSERSKPERTARPLTVGCLIFERMDQIDFTGPFEVLSRMSDTTIQIIGKELEPVRDVQGLRLSPDVRIAEAGIFDVLLVPGGYGQLAVETRKLKRLMIDQYQDALLWRQECIQAGFR